MKSVALIILFCGVVGGNFVIKNGVGGQCLTAVGTASERLSFVMTSPCSSSLENTELSQQWAFDASTGGKICSASIGSCLVLFSAFGQDPDISSAAVVLSAGWNATGYYPEVEFDYDPTTKSLFVPGNCNRVLATENGAWAVQMQTEHACTDTNMYASWIFLPV
jgi:hypothetical protein